MCICLSHKWYRSINTSPVPFADEQDISNISSPGKDSGSRQERSGAQMTPGCHARTDLMKVQDLFKMKFSLKPSKLSIGQHSTITSDVLKPYATCVMCKHTGSAAHPNSTCLLPAMQVPPHLPWAASMTPHKSWTGVCHHATLAFTQMGK